MTNMCGSMEMETREGLKVYRFCMEDDNLVHVIIPYRRNKLISIEWYLEDEYYIEHYLSDTPQEYQRIFRVLNKMVVQGITDIDYFEI
jgi:hypothetical protein